MTKLLELALDSVRKLPSDEKDLIARAMPSLAGAGDQAGEPIEPEHLADAREGLARARRREFSSEAEIEAAFARFRS